MYLNQMRSHPYFQMERPLINQDQVLFICSFAASFQETKTSMIESIFNKFASCKIQHKQCTSKIKFQLFQFWELIVFSTEAFHRCSSKWPKKPVTLLKGDSNARCSAVKFAKFLKTTFFTEHLWWLLLSPKQIERNKKIF